MFARRRSSSLSYNKFSCLNIALLTCFLLAVLENVTSMSIDRLDTRQYQQQNDKQLEFSEFMLPEAESGFLQNDMELVPADDEQSDMYLLVPAVSSQQQTEEEQNLQSQVKQQEQVYSENNANLENNSDMLMLESDDTPAVQILELPEDISETKISEDVQEQNKNQVEELQVSDNEMDNLVETVQEIKKEIETELLSETSEEQNSTEKQQVIEEDNKEQETKDLLMEHKDNNLELSEDIANAGIEKASAEEGINSEQEMIGVVLEEADKFNAANPVMDLVAEESEVQPATMEINNKSKNETNSENENKFEEALEILQEKEKVDAQPSETLNNENETKENVSTIEETVAEMEENSNVEQLQDDEIVEDIKTEQEFSESQTPANEELQIENETTTEFQKENHNVDNDSLDEDSQVNKLESEESTDNEIQPVNESQEALDNSEKDSVENQDTTEQPQNLETETESTDQANDETISSAEETEPSQETEPSEEIQQQESTNNEDDTELKPEQESKPVEGSVEKMEMLAESQMAEEADTTEENMKPIKEIEMVQNMQQQVDKMEEFKPIEELEQVGETNPVEDKVQSDEEQVDEMKEFKPVEELEQDGETNPVEDKVQSDEELSAAVENHPIEETQNLEQAEAIKETQTDQISEESQQDEFALDKTEEESQPAKEVETMEGDQSVKESEILKEDVKEEVQSVENAQSIDTAQSMEEVQPMDELIEQSQLMDEPQLEEDASTTEKAQLMEEAQAIEEELKPTEQTIDDAQPIEVEEVNTLEEGQTHIMEEVKPTQEAQYVQETQPMEDLQVVENTEANFSQEEVNQEEEPQTTEEIQADEESQDATLDQSVTEEAEPAQIVIEETQSMDKESEHIENEETAIVPEETTSVYNEEISTEISADKLVNENDDDNLNKETALVSEEDQDTPTEIFADELVDDETKDKQNQEAQPIVLADENILQNVDTVEEDQKHKQEDTTAVEIHKPLDDKNSDNILNDDTNESEISKETTSMLTAIIQVPTKEELAQQQQQTQQLAENLETTLKPLNVLDSAFNYVNASFMNQINNSNDDVKQEVKEEDEQPFNSKLRRYDGAQVWRIVVQNDREKKLADELQTKFDGQLWKEVKQEVDYLLKPHVLAEAERHVKAANLTRIVLIDNLQKVIEVENPPAEEIAQLQNRKGHRLTWQAYHRLEDIHSFFDYLAKTYPDICSVETIGYSIEKRPLKILKVSNGNANNPGVWIDGGMHAREWISPAVVTYIANQIVEGWDDLPSYMRNVNWYIHAVANPDGYEYSHTTDRLWRKNMRSHGRVCPGVDLNRNFGYKWGGKGTSANPCSQTYRGSKAFSEPETFYISKFISNFPRETFKAYLSFHSYGQYILYPWGYDYHVTKDMADLDLVARQAGTIITKSTGVKYTVGSSANTLYPAAGGSDDWAKGIAGIKFSYTIEMGDTGRYGFVLPADHIEPNGKNGFTFVDTIAKAITMGKNARRRKLKAYKSTH